MLGAVAVFGRDAHEVSDGESGADQAGGDGSRNPVLGVPGRFGAGVDYGQVAAEQADSRVCGGECSVRCVLVRAAVTC